ncbi:PEP-CTERM sorting domain-containing protein [Nostoc sp. ChiVER01]|uniref:PEP-CTERM sorting domain-containing protein n=1 Tax=Nostoc sp. ChiVER01 TaxID=3075382 RepID=UPI002AD2B761|nr:PEP-CTERM sorting domain-containing protein [Nostoc sp. ChiVER01]MDZ8222674.1 PEP-CTERM sorting domain-containing protein [Nostoc sp. ChiVER01]
MTKNNTKKAVAQAISTAVALGWVIMQVESAQAATLTVNNLNDSGVGSLRDTINIANNNDVVDFLVESHPSTISLTSGPLALTKNLTINGPGANLLTISSNNHFPVFDINAADVKFSGLAIAGSFNAYNSSNLTFTNSTVSSDNFKIDSNLRLINSTINSNNIEINAGDVTLTDNSQLVSSNDIKINANNVTLTDHSQLVSRNDSGAAGSITVTASEAITITGSDVLPTRVPEPSAIAAGSNHSGLGGNITINSGALILRPGATISKPVPKPSALAKLAVGIAAGSNHSGAGGNITLRIPDLLILKPVRKPSAIADDSNNSGLGGNISINSSFIIAPPNEPSAIAGDSNNSGAGGTLTVTASSISLTKVPEPSAIAGSILACSMALLAKRKQGAFRKAKI